MKKQELHKSFSSPRERQRAIETLELEITRLMGEIDKAYSHLGRCFHAMTEQETVGINEKVDKVVELKKKLRKLKEKGAREAE